jgi:hypothetical protein
VKWRFEPLVDCPGADCQGCRHTPPAKVEAGRLCHTCRTAAAPAPKPLEEPERAPIKGTR